MSWSNINPAHAEDFIGLYSETGISMLNRSVGPINFGNGTSRLFSNSYLFLFAVKFYVLIFIFCRALFSSIDEMTLFFTRSNHFPPDEHAIELRISIFFKAMECKCELAARNYGYRVA